MRDPKDIGCFLIRVAESMENRDKTFACKYAKNETMCTPLGNVGSPEIFSYVAISCLQERHAIHILERSGKREIDLQLVLQTKIGHEYTSQFIARPFTEQDETGRHKLADLYHHKGHPKTSNFI